MGSSTSVIALIYSRMCNLVTGKQAYHAQSRVQHHHRTGSHAREHLLQSQAQHLLLEQTSALENLVGATFHHAAAEPCSECPLPFSKSTVDPPSDMSSESTLRPLASSGKSFPAKSEADNRRPSSRDCISRQWVVIIRPLPSLQQATNAASQHPTQHVCCKMQNTVAALLALAHDTDTHTTNDTSKCLMMTVQQCCVPELPCIAHESTKVLVTSLRPACMQMQGSTLPCKNDFEKSVDASPLVETVGFLNSEVVQVHAVCQNRPEPVESFRQGRPPAVLASSSAAWHLNFHEGVAPAECGHVTCESFNCCARRSASICHMQACTKASAKQGTTLNTITTNESTRSETQSI